MKSESFIYTGLQKPMTLFGLPPVLLALTMAAPGVVFAMMVALGFAAPALPVALGTFAVLAVYVWRRTRRDHHFESMLLVPPRFWRGRTVRRLIAGHPPQGRTRGSGGRL